METERFIEKLRNTPLIRDLMQKAEEQERVAAVDMRAAKLLTLAKNDEARNKALPPLLAARDAVAAKREKIRAALKEVDSEFDLANQAVIAKDSEFAVVRSRAEQELRDLADPRIDRLIQRLREQHEHERHSGIVTTSTTDVDHRGNLRIASGTTNAEAMGRRLQAIRDAITKAEAMKTQDVDVERELDALLRGLPAA